MKLIASNLLALILISVCSVLPASAGQLYMWEDAQGIKHVTDKPPENSAKVIGQTVSEPTSPEEIRAFQAKQRRALQNMEAQRLREEAIRNRNQEIEESKRRINSYVDQKNRIIKESEQRLSENKREQEEYLKYRKEHSRALENRDYDEAKRLSNKYDRERIDRELRQ